jgi:5'-deoxynucleotidase YfbR-like HD superfamily hydrolase
MTWMLTASGRRFDLADPESQVPNVDDVAAALAKICRFGGHTTRFYSVAEHCVHVSYAVGAAAGIAAHPGLLLLALLHDAHEAYTGDRVRPLKDAAARENRDTWFADLEHDVKCAIHTMLLPSWLLDRLETDAATDELWHAFIKRADLEVLAAEKLQVMPVARLPADNIWPCLEGITPAPFQIHGWSPAQAETEFGMRYRTLMQLLHKEGPHA